MQCVVREQNIFKLNIHQAVRKMGFNIKFLFAFCEIMLHAALICSTSEQNMQTKFPLIGNFSKN